MALLRRSGLAILNLTALRKFIRREPQGEFGMMLLAKPTWRTSTSVLGFRFVRRSWWHHLIVDFLGTHPRVLGSKREKIRGVGSGILNQLVELATTLSIPCIWGEATVNSVSFYRRVTGMDEIRDHFIICGPLMDAVRRHDENLHSRGFSSYGQSGII